MKNYPVWVDWVTSRKTKGGNWTITIAEECWGRLGQVTKKVYIDGKYSEEQALNLSLWRVHKYLKPKSVGHWIVSRIRTDPKVKWERDDLHAIQNLMDMEYGTGWLYTNEEAQMKVIDYLKLGSFEALNYMSVKYNKNNVD